MSGPGAGGTTSSQPTLPTSLYPIYFPSINAVQQGQTAAEGAGGLAGLLKPNPEQIAQLTPYELADINTLQSFGERGAPGEQQAMNQLNFLTSGPVGSSPATEAGMRAYEQNIAPTITSSIAASGGGRGGEITAAEEQGQTSAYAPLVQQEIQNRLSSVPLYSQLAAQRSGDVSTALNAADLPRQIQQAGFSSVFQDFLRRAGITENLLEGPAFTLGPGLLGSNTVATPGKF